MTVNDATTFEMTRIIDAPREAVFRAWTDPEQFKRWWGPGQFTTPEAEFDLRVGGTYALVMQPPDGGALRLAGTFREIVPPERLVYTWRWTSGVPDPRETVVTVTFAEAAGKTRVTVRHEGFAGGEGTEPYRTGWVSGLEKLNALVASK